MEKTELFKCLSESIEHLDEESTLNYVRKVIELNIDPVEALEKGLMKGLRKLGELFGRGEIFIVDLIFASEIMKKAMDILQPVLIKHSRKGFGTIVIGTVEGDIHELGKTLVATMLRVEGFEVHDLGVDVPTEVYLKSVKELRPDLVGLSALMTTTMLNQRKVIEALEKEGLRGKVKIMIGGAPVSASWAKKIGADCYAENAIDAVKKAKELLKAK
jgi:corrinoid protein of di/trimethylamine methyltransferase